MLSLCVGKHLQRKFSAILFFKKKKAFKKLVEDFKAIKGATRQKLETRCWFDKHNVNHIKTQKKVSIRFIYK